MTACGHTAETFDHGPLVCELPQGHKGPHEQRTRLRDRIERTNWADDGTAIWARDPIVKGRDGLPRLGSSDGPVYLP